MEYGANPPVIVTVAVPSHVPLQEASVETPVNSGPSILLTGITIMAEHPLPSVTVTVYVPATRLVAVAVEDTFGTHE
jgi:hypothetical protein